MGDIERTDLARQFAELATTVNESRAQTHEEIRAFRQENKNDNRKIIERLDGSVDPHTGAMTGGICNTIKDHDRHITTLLKSRSRVAGVIWICVCSVSSAAVGGLFIALAEKWLLK